MKLFCYALHLLGIISAARSYINPNCTQWPNEGIWQTELENLLSENAQLYGPLDPDSFFDECFGSDPFQINKAGDGICMHLFSCAFQFCRPDMEENPALNLPVYIVEAKTPDDISSAVKFAKKHDIAVSVKTTGHSYQGSSTSDDSLLVWMQNYPKDGAITENFQDSCGTTTDTVIGINGGEVWDDVLAAVSDKYHIVTGSGRTVSAAGGWLQGVGLSFSSRKYGVGIDNVVEFDVVLADGSQVKADACTNADLFWALRGGGGGTFGVVTHVQYKLYPKTPILQIDWGLRSEAPENDQDFQFARLWLTYWIKVSPTLDDRWSGFYHAFGFYLVFTGSAEDADTTFVNDFENWYFSTFGLFSNIEKPRDSIEMWDSWYDHRGGREATGNPDFAIPTGDEHEGVEFLGARLMPKSLVEEKPGQVLAFLLDLLTIDYAFVNHFLGGQINAVDDDATAVHPAMRNAIWAVFWTSDEAGEVVRDFLPNSITGASFNHHQTTEPDWTESLWGSNYDRLLVVKDKYDPDRVFNCWHCIGYQGREFGEPMTEKKCPVVFVSPCFASDMKVQVLLNADEKHDIGPSTGENNNVVMKKMQDLRVGDKVLVDTKGQYETIYDFGHYEPALEATYLEFAPSGLKLSKDHMVFVKGKAAPVPASAVQVGDLLLMQGGQYQTVTSIQAINQFGAYAPFTSSGTIVVNGVQASTFISFQESDTLLIGGISTGLTYQWMAHTFELPHKWFRSYSMSMNHMEDGISSWASRPLDFAQWWLEGDRNALVVGLVALPVVLSLCVLAVVEWITRNPTIGLFLLVSITVVMILLFNNLMIVRSGSNKKKKKKFM